MSATDNNPQDTLLQTQIESLRTLVGAERFDRADPGMTLRQASTNWAPTIIPTKVVPVADVPTVRRERVEETIVKPGGETESRKSSSGFATDYAIDRRVAGGGMGDIFLARQNALRREVAIKKIKPEQLKPEKAQQMEAAFISEGLVTGFLDHPNIVPVHGMGRDDDGQCYFSMKLVRGIEWRQLLHPACCKDDASKAKALERNLDIDDPTRRAAHLAENLRLLATVCNAVAFAHSKNIIHRDLKPENVMVGAFGEVLAMDWGLAVDVSETPPPPGHPERRVPPRASGGFGGTPSYMAPEQVPFDENGQPHSLQLGCWTDVFLLGGMLYELLAGKPPHAGSDIKSLLLTIAECAPAPLPDSVPKELAEICRKAMAKDPAERYPDAGVFQKALQEFLTHREAALIAAEAETEARTPEIASLSRAVVLYGQALKLWPENAAMAGGHKAAKALLAIKESRARWIKRSLGGAVAAIVVLTTVAYFWISAARNDALAQAAIAEQKTKEEAAQRKIAVENERLANEQKILAENALKTLRIKSFDDATRIAVVDDAAGESAKVIDALSDYLTNDELATHEKMKTAKALVAKARDGYERFKVFAAKVKARDKTVSLDLGQGVTLELILISAGKFMMGSPNSDKDRYVSEEPQHEVTISKPFYMGKFTVTQEQYKAVVGTDPSYWKGKKKNPVENLTWGDAAAFCEKLNKQSGAAKTTFALPTEAQWEYACRAGTTTRYYFGDDDKDVKELEKYAWFETNAGVKSGNYGTQAVGGKPANPFGLFDMHGNVYQWCQDWYDADYYKTLPKIDPTGPKEGVVQKLTNTEARVLRGGSFYNSAGSCRAAIRIWSAPDDRGYFVGFRVVLSLDF